MEIKKVNDSYNVYKLEMSYLQLVTLHAKLQSDHTGPVADEMYGALDFYLKNLPGPGETEEEKKEEDNGKDGDKKDVSSEPKNDEKIRGMDPKDLEKYADRELPEPPSE